MLLECSLSQLSIALNYYWGWKIDPKFKKWLLCLFRPEALIFHHVNSRKDIVRPIAKWSQNSSKLTHSFLSIQNDLFGIRLSSEVFGLGLIVLFLVLVLAKQVPGRLLCFYETFITYVKSSSSSISIFWLHALALMPLYLAVARI